MTYIPMAKGFLYLVAIIDWYSRKVLAWQLSNTMDADFYVEALREALATYGPPEIFNTDQGSQFTSEALTAMLREHRIQIQGNRTKHYLVDMEGNKFWPIFGQFYINQ